MAVLIDTRCHVCEKLFADVWSDELTPMCCGKQTLRTPSLVKTDEWGSPRTYLHIRDEPFTSRGELAAYAKAHGMTLGAANERVGGARNEDHLHLGKIYSYAKR